MKQSKLLITALTMAFAIPAVAAETPSASPVTYNIGIVSDYIVRGLTQTSHKPAIQGGGDYAHGSGFYLGAWASNVRWIKDSGAVTSGDGTVELDTYLGIKNYVVADVSYDLGLVRYNYLGGYEPNTAGGFNNADTLEAYVAVAHKWLSIKYSYSLLDGFLTTPGTKGTNYLDLTATYPFADSGMSLIGHYGKQTFVGKTTDTPGNALSYEDYKVAHTQDFSGYVLGLNYTSTNASNAWTFNGQQWGKSNVMLSLTHTF
ncbi:MAG: TorF family putative porin [Gallionellaceae bacterium]|nr:TorF family putative porin [Gallionellaceae bacterium]